MRLLFVPLITIILTGCEGHYRYPCQDPANWGKLECNNDVCKAEGTCTADVLAPAGSREFGITMPAQTSEETTDESSNNSLQDDENEISNSGCAAPQEFEQVSYKGKGEEERIFNVKNKMELPEQEVVMDPEGDEFEPPARTPPSMEDEQPLSMNTVVDTAAHNAAVK
jgi:hypothetical protein